MCGRFAVTLPPEAMASLFESSDRPNFAPNYNVAPTQKVPIVAIGKENTRRIIMARWGLLPNWMEKDPQTGPMFNARSETLDTKNSFKVAFEKRRCIIPADGFYEWQRTGNARTPFFISRRDNMPIAFAGLWEMKKSENGTGEILISTTIITTNSSPEFANLHDRFPVILEKEDWGLWLDAQTSQARLKNLFNAPNNGVMRFHKVSDAVNKVANNDESLLQPL
jgi:putative SOS response-associated peptidase YedK